MRQQPIRDEAIPVARPPASPLAGIHADKILSVEEPWLTPETMKGWATSLTLHSLILLAMALWSFSPKAKPSVVIDSRLAGSDMGVEEGLAATGGLNTPIELQASSLPAPEPSPLFKPAEV